MLFSFILLSILLFRFLTIQNYRLQEHTLLHHPVFRTMDFSFGRQIIREPIQVPVQADVRNRADKDRL